MELECGCSGVMTVVFMVSLLLHSHVTSYRPQFHRVVPIHSHGEAACLGFRMFRVLGGRAGPHQDIAARAAGIEPRTEPAAAVADCAALRVAEEGLPAAAAASGPLLWTAVGQRTMPTLEIDQGSLAFGSVDIEHEDTRARPGCDRDVGVRGSATIGRSG
jgi:hypothetical protein